MALDASAKQILETIAAAQAKGAPQLQEVSPAEARQMHLRSKDVFGTDGPDLLDVHDDAVAGVVADIPIRIYRDSPKRQPVVVYYHGGGWVIGDLDSHDGLCRHIAKASGFTVISVDYRLAPEHRFPAAVDDAYAALLGVVARAEELAIDPMRVAVAGDSAGGNLAAVVAQLAKAQNGPELALQALLYPATDLQANTASHATFTDHLLTPAAYRWFVDLYTGQPADRDDPRASPLRAESVAGLARAFVLTAGFDPLRDEGEAYAQKLAGAGVPVSYRCYDGQIHGFLTLDRVVKEANAAVAELAEALQDAMGRV
ncbi:MAG: alpha/beta hydrolase [Pseudomonadota bacterium]